mmetsp:Transcript_183353/g.581447  ORF Transcript_183353/g.581447 Transcript_183353/m.581447 type:complete len:194 (+) Transcript_183353:1277-1858(+)
MCSSAPPAATFATACSPSARARRPGGRWPSRSSGRAPSPRSSWCLLQTAPMVPSGWRSGTASSACIRHVRCDVQAACSDGAGDFPGVYVVRVCYGAPGQSTGMSARNFLLEVDGRPIRCLDDLPPAPATPSPGALGADVRVRVVDHIGREGMQTLRPDPVFWPLIELHRQSDGSWTRLLPSGTAGAESARDQP